MLIGSKCAASRAIFVVCEVTSEANPPIVPANARAEFVSQINKLSAESLRSTLSKVTSFENLLALATLRPPVITSASNACSGWPNSSIT